MNYFSGGEEYILRKTSQLAVFGNVYMAEDMIKIHPNDGFDVNLMHTNQAIKVNINVKASKQILQVKNNLNCSVLLDNECKLGTIEVSHKLWKKIGKPRNVVLVHKQKQIFMLSI